MASSYSPDHQSRLEGGDVEFGDEDRSNDEFWLQLQRTGWEQADSWFNSSVRSRAERNLAHYKSRHAPGSKYYREEYAKRSRLFRPKTRTAIRKQAAAIVRAFFATQDALSVKAMDTSNEEHRLAAEVHQIVLNWRLENSVPWYKITVAAMTEAAIHGIVISKQYWEYEEEQLEEESINVTRAGVKAEKRIVRRVKHDRPMSRIVPIENFRISPGSDWLDPIESSPYIIEQRPYFLSTLRDRMMSHSKIPYRVISDAELRTGRENTYDSIRAKREDSRDRFADIFASNSDHDIVWVREVIVRIDGMDYYYETLSDSKMLSDPVPLSRVSKIGRAYVMGQLEIEPHSLTPDGTSDLGHQIQTEANEVSNSRIDNVRLAMTGRYIVARGRQTDIRTLMKNVPGSVTFSQNVNDVKDMRPPDVTASSYQEQDRLNLDMDDLLGIFSQSTVQSNRAMNETVGGMTMLQEGSNELMEMIARNFAETWYQPALQQHLLLESHHESDAMVLRIAGDKLGQSVGEVFRMMQTPASVAVNVGFGNTNPLMRIERLRVGLETFEAFAPGSLLKADQNEIAKEVFGALGYKDGARFFPHLADNEENPQVAQMQAQIDELTAMLEGEQAKEQTKLQIEEIRAMNRREIEEIRAASKQFTEEMRAQVKAIDQQIAQEKNEIAKRELYMQREALSHTIQDAERRLTMEEAQFEATFNQDIPDAEPQQELIDSLRTPSSGTPIKERKDGVTTAEVTDDRSGVLARGDYGIIPFMEG